MSFASKWHFLARDESSEIVEINMNLVTHIEGDHSFCPGSPATATVHFIGGGRLVLDGWKAEMLIRERLDLHSRCQEVRTRKEEKRHQREERLQERLRRPPDEIARE